ncbi:uncharacterized protein LOC141855049 isoform X2 [Brevipalpus obovatus]|uniref:uncharacterized protein LOC141855049 isoform X2 n=1 Tax=Brevipalpus obovatus TaxID=246614 RepID=UPI003D9E9D37
METEATASELSKDLSSSSPSPSSPSSPSSSASPEFSSSVPSPSPNCASRGSSESNINESFSSNTSTTKTTTATFTTTASSSSSYSSDILTTATSTTSTTVQSSFESSESSENMPQSVSVEHSNSKKKKSSTSSGASGKNNNKNNSNSNNVNNNKSSSNRKDAADSGNNDSKSPSSGSFTSMKDIMRSQSRRDKKTASNASSPPSTEVSETVGIKSGSEESTTTPITLNSSKPTKIASKVNESASPPVEPVVNGVHLKHDRTQSNDKKNDKKASSDKSLSVDVVDKEQKVSKQAADSLNNGTSNKKLSSSEKSEKINMDDSDNSMIDTIVNGNYQSSVESKLNGHHDDSELSSLLSSSRNSECDWNGSDIYFNNGNDIHQLIVSSSKSILINSRNRHEYTVDVAKLKNQYANHISHEKNFCKPIINTGIDFESLKHNYSKNDARSSNTIVCKNALNKELNSIGVNIRSLKTSFVDENGVQDEGIKIDTSKAQKRFSQDNHDDLTFCAVCEKHVYLMDKLKAGKKCYHKSCFRCKQCNKSLYVDTYQTHEGELYCQPHFKQLHQPKPHFESEDITPCRRSEMIVRESNPVELPPDVVRYDAKLDDGLDNLQLNLTNIRQRFESGTDSDRLSSASPIPDKGALQRSESLQIRMARYQSAAAGDKMADIHAESSSGESSDEEGDLTLVRETKTKEKVPFAGLSSLRSQWESGTVPKGENPSDEPIQDDDTKTELYKLRQKICLGRSASMRQMYEKGCVGSPSVSPAPRAPESLNIESSGKATSLKEKFESGQIDNETEEERLERLRKEKEEDLKFAMETDTAREAKNMFKQLDASLVKSGNNSSISPAHHSLNQNSNASAVNRPNRFTHNSEPLFRPAEVVKCSDPKVKEEVVIQTKDLQERYKFFESYQEKEEEHAKKRLISSPSHDLGDSVDATAEPRVEILPNANIIRQDDFCEEIPKIDTTAKMLNKFKQLESQASLDHTPPSGPKPLKRITPPREFTRDVIESQPSIDRDPNIVRSSYKTEDVIPVEPELARSLTAKFENWNSFDVEKENRKNSTTEEGEELPQVNITKNLRAKYEAIQDEYIKPTEKPVKPKVNRFNDFPGNGSEECSICHKRLYPMEKLEFSGIKMHKNCFKCSHCLSSLRLENYTLSAGKFFCLTHFKQLFMTKGNYDEGFGVVQHKEKWRNRAPSRNSTEDSDILSPEEEDKDSSFTDQITV